MLDKLDIIIPTFNRWKELHTTLNVLLTFRIQQEQIFIYDDSSNNETEKNILALFPEVHYFRPSTKGNGVIKARNYLWSCTSQPYVLSLDDDSAPIKKEDIIEAIKTLSSKPNAGIFAFALHESPNAPIELPSETNLRPIRLFTACGCIFKQEVLKSLKYYAWERLFFHGEELDCSIRAFKKNYNVITRDDIIIHHRVDWNKRNLKRWGKYGKIWRSANGFSANLIIALKHYPLGLDIAFIGLYIIKRFWQYAVKKGHFIGFIYGILRFSYFIPSIILSLNKLSYKQFKEWISLPTI
ncbi:glycosyltransferase family 2 protein [Labilibacter marinus]|uniref:glycosyltransferase family 2 protein n=1 Tax=Labilibacter marinus TaxID=1477105 RepID=UPI00094FC71E|nr:glycosyltransferase [Labilibacter marinus]